MYEIVVGRNNEDRKKLGLKGTILLGKHYVKMGETTSLSNQILMDVNRSHVVFICGKRGSGKCLTGDTLVTLANGLEVPIRDLAENEEEVMGLNKDLKIQKMHKSDFFKREVTDILRIKLRSGKEIKLTPEHPLLTLVGWKEAIGLTVGSRIATARKIPAIDNQVMNDDEIKVLAYLIAEGHTNKSILFSNEDEILMNEFSSSIRHIHPDLTTLRTKEGCVKVSPIKIDSKVEDYHINRDVKTGRFPRGGNINISKTQIGTFAEKYGIYGLLSIEKKISDHVFMLPKNQIALFLNRLFSCDGSIYLQSKQSKCWEVSYSSSSKILAKQVQSLLLRFEITSKLRGKKVKYKQELRNNFELVLSGESVILFLEQIGFFGKKELRENIALEQMKTLKRNTNTDTIPKELWSIYRPRNWTDVGRKMNYNTHKSLRSTIDYSISRQKLKQIAIADKQEWVGLLADSDIFWDEIVSIEKIEGKQWVYDITVPEAHNFIANNIIVHNSYTMGVIAEGISDLPTEVKNNISIVLLDTMGIYWTMKYPNKNDPDLLKEWGLEAKGLAVQIYTPTGYYKEYKESGIPTDFPFSIKPSELDASDWCMSLGVNLNSEIGVTIERAVTVLREKGEDYDIDSLTREVKELPMVKEEIRLATENRFLAAKKWGLFDKEGTPISHLVKGGQVTVLDVSCYATAPGAANLRALVIGLVGEKLFRQRMIARKKEEYDAIKDETSLLNQKKDKDKDPLVWLVIDEAHEFLPNEGSTSASGPLITILREGRQPGISLILATQQPGKIHTDVMTQSDIVISHRITANYDVSALGMLMQSYMREGLDKQLNYLPRLQGAAIIFDDSNEKMYPMRMRPRLTWHGGSSPRAMQDKKKLFDF